MSAAQPKKVCGKATRMAWLECVCALPATHTGPCRPTRAEVEAILDETTAHAEALRVAFSEADRWREWPA